MSPINVKALVGRLDDTARRSLEGAAGLCLSRSHYNVEIEHWLLKLVEETDNDVAAILRHFGIDAGRLAADLSRAIERFKTGNSRPPALAPGLVDLAREAWLIASLEHGCARTRTGHLVEALLGNEFLARQAYSISEELEKISPETLHREHASIVAGSPEADAVRLAEPGAAPAADGESPSLERFCVDLTALARAGEIDPVIGREPEIRQVVDILTRRRQNNPIITGEAGVGKTAVAEGFALRIASGDVPSALENVRLLSLDLSLLQAGAGIRGEFEERLKGVIQEVKASPRPIVLFIDEAHTLVGAGGGEGQGDAANLLKPALARGELRTIAATTWAEYKRYFEKDAALTRRFQVVKVEEPDEQSGIAIMHGVAGVLEKHHGVRILEEALEDSVRLSMRYITGRQLPDKSVSVLDTACARVALSQSATPPAIEDRRSRQTRLGVTLDSLEREHATRPIHAQRIAELRTEREGVAQELSTLEERWERERGLVADLRETRLGLEAAVVDEAETREAELDGLRGRMEELTTALHEVQGQDPLIHAFVDSQGVAEVIANWTGIPVGRMVEDEIRTILALRERMAEQIIGQDHALEALSRSIRTSRAHLEDPKRPIGVFLLVGSSGVGKTETGKVLAELLYGGEQNMTVINMSEFKEEHKVSLLMGSPPGYVGYGEGGVLTEAVRRKPYSVVLLDEFEKAHPGVQDVFYRVFDEGTLTDGEGRDIDFRNTVILMTTNAGTDTIMSLCADPETRPAADALGEALRPELLQTFKPAFLGRVNVLPYLPLDEEVLRRITVLKLDKIGRRIGDNYQAAFEYAPELVDSIVARCREVETGARAIDHILTRTLQPELASEFLGSLADERTVRSVRAGVSPSGAFEYVLR